MNKLIRSLAIFALAAMVVVGSTTMVFATNDASSEEETIAGAVDTADTDTAGDEADAAVSDDGAETTEETDAATTESPVATSPNTGVPIAPLAIALLGAASVPVMIKTRKK